MEKPEMEEKKATKDTKLTGEDRDQSGFSRRSFLVGAAAAGASMAAVARFAYAEHRPASTAAAKVAPKETFTADVVVCGTGSSGMAAAVRAGELGAKVIVLEKLPESFLGGSSAFTSALFAVGSSMTPKGGDTKTVEQAYKEQIEYHRYAANARVLHRFMSRSGATIDWLISQGIEFSLHESNAPNTHFYVTPQGKVGEGSTGWGLKVLYGKGKAHGVKYLFETPATELVMKDGKVASVIATKKNGDRIAIHAPVVVIATGGYSDSKELFDRFTVYNFDSFESYGLAGRTGDGIKLGLSVGAALHHPQAISYCNPKLTGEQEVAEVNVCCCKQQPLIWVNESAVRFADEGTIDDWTQNGQAIALQRKMFTIADRALFERIQSNGVWHGEPLTNLQPGVPLPNLLEKIDRKVAVHNSATFKADTVEKLALLLGLDPKALADTVDTYNTYVASGKDTEFGKRAEWLLPIKQAPFYGFRTKLAFFNTIGGLKVDEYTRVLAKADGRPIPGLYACGSDAGGVFGYSYDITIAPGTMQGWCSTSGLAAAEDAVQRYIKA
jgi:fumarate reductase flavoprotein subunit